MTKEKRSNYWRSLIDKQAGSGLTAAAFCREHQINRDRFYHWRRRLRNDRVTGSELSGFVQLVSYQKKSSSTIRIHLDNNICIEVERGFDPHTLRAVVDAVWGVEGKPCSP
jgi:transposase-like protein